MTAVQDVWTDPELRELVRDEPELAAIADALAQARVAERPRRTLVSPTRLGMVAVAVAAAVALALVAPWERSGGSASNLALAALGKQPVLHAVVRTEVDDRTASVVEIATGRSRAHTYETELWYDAQRRVTAIHVIKDGTVVGETLKTPGSAVDASGARSRPGGFRLAPTPALTGFLSRYRQALADGRARVTGHGTLGGRRVVILTIQRHPDRLADEVALDAESYHPLRFRSLDRQRGRAYDWQTIVTIETLPRRPGQFAEPVIVRDPSSGRVRDGGEIEVTDATKVLGRPALWPGESVAGLRLAEAHREELRTSYPRADRRPPVVGPGVRLDYGSPDDRYRGGAFVEIQQSAWPHMGYRLRPSPAGPTTFGGFPLPPPGWVDVSVAVLGDSRDATVLRMGRHGETILRIWMGQLRKDNLYLTVTASSRKLLLQALRQLRPLR